MTAPSLEAAAEFLDSTGVNSWLVYDFRGSSGILPRLLPPKSTKRWTTRRVLLVVPARRAHAAHAHKPRLLVHAIDHAQFADVVEAGQVDVTVYLSWNDLLEFIARAVREFGPTVAMEYAPLNALPVISTTDAGTVELVRAQGATVVSSADVIQACIARWSDAAVAAHDEDSAKVTAIKDEAFALIRARRSAGTRITEKEVQDHILKRFAESNLTTADAPVVAVNEHSADPHFEVSASGSSSISTGDWILIDLWARRPGEEHIFSDITWVGFAGAPAALTPRHRHAFEAVKAARDASLLLAQSAHRTGTPVHGWQLDEAARDRLIGDGYGPYIRHRTGHSLSPGPAVHGMGMNLDNLETRDTRLLLPGIGFTIEPGVYMPGPGGFGVRLEINVFADPKAGPRVTSCLQDDILFV